MDNKNLPVLPVDDYLLVNKKETTGKVGSLYVPQSSQLDTKAPLLAEVLASGPGRMCEDGTRNRTGYFAGDTVVVGPFRTEIEVRYGDRMYLLVRANDVVAKIVDEEAA